MSHGEEKKDLNKDAFVAVDLDEGEVISWALMEIGISSDNVGIPIPIHYRCIMDFDRLVRDDLEIEIRSMLRKFLKFK